MSSPDAWSLLAALAILVVGWRRPAIAAAFVLVGQIPYYAVLAMVGVPTSGELTGVVFGLAAAVALLRNLLARPARLVATRDRSLPTLVALFFVFVGIWYLRWLQDPPGLTYSASDDVFAQRALVFMLVFSILPFCLGLTFRSESGRAEFVRWVIVFGIGGLLSVAGFWMAGATSQQPDYLGTWEPIPFLTGIILSMNIGLGALAIYASWSRRPGWTWRLGSIAIAAGATAILVRVGQRGPFVFFLASLGLVHLMHAGSAWPKRVASIAVAALLVGYVALTTGDTASSGRAVDVANYRPEQNENRFAIAGVAANAFLERPLLGWGGGLIGRPVGSAYWQYSHMLLLDPLLEAGLIGAVPFYALVALLLRRILKRAPSLSRSDPSYLPLLAMGAYALLESEVSGHVAMGRHFWLLAALLGIASGAAASPAATPAARPAARRSP